MKKIIQIALLKVSLAFKDKTAFPLMFIAPILFVFILVIGFGGGGNNGSGEGKYPISLVNNDKAYYSEEFIKMLKNDKTFKLVEADYDKAKKDVEDYKTAMGIVIPREFSNLIEKGQNGQVELLKLQDTENTIAMTAVISNYLKQLKVGQITGEAAVQTLSSMNVINEDGQKEIKQKVEGNFIKGMLTPNISYSSENLIKENKPGLDSMSTAAIGVLVMFIMFFVTGGAGAILEEKEVGTWTRLNSAPTSNGNILGGFILGNFILGWIQVGVLILVSRYMFNINWGNSVIGLILLFSCFLLAIIGFGAALSSFVKSKAQLSSLTSIIVVPTCLLAGCFWPKDIMPDIMIKIADFIPQTWVLKGMTDLVARGSDVGAILIPCMVLIIFAGIFFTTGITFMNSNNK